MNRFAPPPPIPPVALRDAVDWAIVTRRSIRAFLPTPVPREDIDAIVGVASSAASGVNTQPRRVHVVTGESKQRLSAAIASAVASTPVPKLRSRSSTTSLPRSSASPTASCSCAG